MKWLIGIVAVGVLTLGWIWYFSQHAAVPAYTPPAAEPPGMGVVGVATDSTDPFDITITSTDEGFSPSNITVHAGTRVRFLNASSGDTWPASGVHPTHTLYPEKEPTDCLGSSFDACRPLAPGRFFDFTFNYLGTWPFHDHLHADKTGSISVEQK